jgi:hypothetical protein
MVLRRTTLPVPRISYRSLKAISAIQTDMNDYRDIAIIISILTLLGLLLKKFLLKPKEEKSSYQVQLDEITDRVDDLVQDLNSAEVELLKELNHVTDIRRNLRHCLYKVQEQSTAQTRAKERAEKEKEVSPPSSPLPKPQPLPS